MTNNSSSKNESAQACGILLVDKEPGMSSADVIRVLKKKLPVYRHKIGHAGTLDPFATGLLVVLVGRATRLVPFLHDGKKSYEGVIRFGLTTDTDDITGTVLAEQQGCVLDEEKLKKKAALLVGAQQQVPPKYSAVKVDGKRAYELARAGEEVSLRAKQVHIYSFDLECKEASCDVHFRVCCSGGTYIRSLARDLGEALGLGACLASLRRTGAEPFSIDEALRTEHLQESSLFPWYKACRDIPHIYFNAEDVTHLLAGRQYPLERPECPILSAHPEKNFAIFADKDSETPLGLLQRNSLRNWELAVNFGFPQA